LKKILSILLTFACLLLVHVRANAQRGAAPAVKQTRSVKGHVLTSTYQPSIRIRFDKSFRYVGSQKFTLYGRAEAEQFFFVDADARGLIRRMYMLQFEHYLPGVDATYNYEAKETVSLGGADYIVNVESVPDVPSALKQVPGSDTARAVEFLKGKGYGVPDAVRYQRFVRLADESKRSEFIMLYVEEAGASQNDERAVRDFRERALKGFTVLK
jgi:hypothetical protein